MWADLRAAFSFLTILPFGYGEGRKPGWSFAAYPLVGLCIGAILMGIAHVSPFDPPITAFAVLAAWVIVTGGLHLDGFGDSCDGLFAAVEPVRRLEIMKDPRAGTWAVVGLFLLLLGKWTAVQSVPTLLLIIVPVTGRWGMVLAAYAFPYARSSGLGAYFREGLSRTQIVIAMVCALTCIGMITLFVHPAAILTVPMMLVVVFGGGSWAAARLNGGLTGDVYGALCELIELGCLLGLSLWASD